MNKRRHKWTDSQRSKRRSQRPLDFALRALLGSVPGLGAHYDVLLCPLVTAWYLLTELGSVVENAGALGAPLPQFLVRAIAVLRADVSQHGGGDDDA